MKIHCSTGTDSFYEIYVLMRWHSGGTSLLVIVFIGLDLH